MMVYKVWIGDCLYFYVAYDLIELAAELSRDNLNVMGIETLGLCKVVEGKP